MPNAMGHLLTASLLSAPAAVVLARILIPAPTQGLTGAEMHSPVRAHGTLATCLTGSFVGLLTW